MKYQNQAGEFPNWDYSDLDCSFWTSGPGGGNLILLLCFSLINVYLPNDLQYLCYIVSEYPENMRIENEVLLTHKHCLLSMNHYQPLLSVLFILLLNVLLYFIFYLTLIFLKSYSCLFIWPPFISCLNASHASWTPLCIALLKDALQINLPCLYHTYTREQSQVITETVKANEITRNKASNDLSAIMLSSCTLFLK